MPAKVRRSAGGWLAALGVAALALWPAEAAAQVCGQIRAQIAQLDSAPAGGAANRRFGAAAGRQRAELANAQRQYQAAGCGGFFQGGQCSALEGRIAQMRANLAQLDAQAGGGGMQSAQRAQQRARLIAAFDANGCRGADTREAAVPARPQGFEPRYDGSPERQIYRQYQTPDSGRPQTAYRVGPQPQQPSGFGGGGFIEHLFGTRRDPQPGGGADFNEPIQEDQSRPDSEEQRPRNVGHRSVCVRLCDGAFFPMTSSAQPGANLGPEEMCQMQCPGAAVEVFRMRDDQIENAVSLSGRPYTALPNALRFRQRFDAACTCRPSNGSWAEAFSNRSDPTLRNGDQVVSPEQARLLSLPASQRDRVREEIAAEQRARRDAERQARIDRSRSRDGRPGATIGIDGTVRPPPEPEPAAIRGSAPGAGEAAPQAPAVVIPESGPREPAEDRRPVRIIGPIPTPRVETPRSEPAPGG